MVAHQPRYSLGLLVGKPEPRPETERDFRAELRMIAAAPLGDVVQQHRAVKRAPRLDTVNDVAGDGHFLGELALADAVDDADREDGVLVDGIDVIHVVLHLGHDASEIRHESPEHAGLVKPPKRDLGIVFGGQHLDEKTVRFRVVADRIDQPQAVGDGAQRLGVDVEPALLGQVKQPENIDRVVGEAVVFGQRHPVAFQFEPFRRAVKHRQSGQREARPAAMLGLQRRTENAREIADLLGDQIIVLHETLDRRGACAAPVSQHFADPLLHVEGQTFLAAPGEIVQMAADRQQEVVGPVEPRRLGLAEYAVLNQVGHVVDPVQELRDPEQGVQIAQPALAFLDVGLQHIARIAHAAVTLGAFRQLGFDEFGSAGRRDLGLEAPPQLIEQFLFAPQQARLEDRGADSEV